MQKHGEVKLTYHRILPFSGVELDQNVTGQETGATLIKCHICSAMEIYPFSIISIFLHE